MNRLSAKKQALIFIIGSAVNLLLFCLTKYTAFPFWLDYAGAFYITTFCGIIPGIASVLLHTLLLIILIDGYWALLPMISAIVAVVIIYLFVKNGERNFHKSLSIAYSASIAAFIINLVIFWCCKSPVGRYDVYSVLFSSAIQGGEKVFAASVISGAITFIEFLLSFIITGIAWFLTPKREENLIFKK